MIEIKLNDKKIAVPSKWTDLTAKQLIAVENTDKTNVLRLFEILSCQEHGYIINNKTKNLEQAVFAVVAFIYNPPMWAEIKAPTHLDYLGKLYKLPKSFDELRFGQKILLSQLALKEKKLVENMCTAVAICMQPTIDKSNYDEKRVLTISEKLLSHNGLMVYGISKFFFRFSAHLSGIGKKDSRKSRQSKALRVKSCRNWLLPAG